DRHRRGDRPPPRADRRRLRRRARGPRARPRPRRPHGSGRPGARRGPLLAPRLRRRARGRPDEAHGMRELIRMLSTLLTPAPRRRGAAFVPFLSLAGAVETAGAGLVFGLIKIAGEPDYVFRHEPLATIFHALPWQSGRGVILTYGVFLAAFFIVRSLILL